MDIKINFEKPEISKNVIKFLEANFINEDDKKSILRIEKGNKLSYMDANSLIQSILNLPFNQQKAESIFLILILFEKIFSKP